MNEEALIRRRIGIHVCGLTWVIYTLCLGFFEPDLKLGCWSQIGLGLGLGLLLGWVMSLEPCSGWIAKPPGGRFFVAWQLENQWVILASWLAAALCCDGILCHLRGGEKLVALLAGPLIALLFSGILVPGLLRLKPDIHPWAVLLPGGTWLALSLLNYADPFPLFLIAILFSLALTECLPRGGLSTQALLASLAVLVLVSFAALFLVEQMPYFWISCACLLGAGALLLRFPWLWPTQFLARFHLSSREWLAAWLPTLALLPHLERAAVLVPLGSWLLIALARLWCLLPLWSRRGLKLAALGIFIAGSIDDSAPLVPEWLRVPQELPYRDPRNTAPRLAEDLAGLKRDFPYESQRDAVSKTEIWRRCVEENAHWAQTEAAVDRALAAPLFCTWDKPPHQPALPKPYFYEYPQPATDLYRPISILDSWARAAVEEKDLDSLIILSRIRMKLGRLLQQKDAAALFSSDYCRCDLGGLALLSPDATPAQIAALRSLLEILPSEQELLELQLRKSTFHFLQYHQMMEAGRFENYIRPDERFLGKILCNSWSWHPQESLRRKIAEVELLRSQFPQLPGEPRRLQPAEVLRPNFTGKMLLQQTNEASWILTRQRNHRRALALILAQRSQKLATGKTPMRVEAILPEFRPVELRNAAGQRMELDPENRGVVILNPGQKFLERWPYRPFDPDAIPYSD
ncbi:MAG: hypothetical protein RL095_3358 [Verrucomicrobiota bacterium]|jgi:hypothetical protein